jgi:hypothetical protein
MYAIYCKWQLTSLVLTASIPRLCISRNICSLGSAPCCSPPALGSSLGASATIQRCLLICSTLYRLLGSSTNILRIKDSQSVMWESTDLHDVTTHNVTVSRRSLIWAPHTCHLPCTHTKKSFLLKVAVQSTLIYTKSALTATIIWSVYQCSMWWMIGFWSPVGEETFLLACLTREALGPMHIMNWYKGSFPKCKATVVWGWPLTSNYCQSTECIKLYLHLSMSSRYGA